MAGDLAITELNYNPLPPTATEAAGLTIDKDSFEFIEFKNVGDAPLNLQGYQFTSGITATLGNVTLQPGQLGVLVRDNTAFQRRYGTGRNVIGTFTSGSLSDGGERIQIVTAGAATEVLDFTYDDQGLWPTRPDGGGATLELVNVNGTTKSMYDKYYSWRASTEINGSPGVENRGQIPVIINEVLTHTDEPVVDAIELYNTSNSPVDIGGWWVSDSGSSPFKYQIPAGTMLGPQAYLVIDEGDFNPNPTMPGPNDFRLSSTGDDVWITTGSPATGVTNVVDRVELPGALNGASFGRHPGAPNVMTPLSRTTLGCENSSARVGSLVISEINYHPGTITPQALAIFPTLVEENIEFIEVHNPTGQTFNLKDWRIRGDVDYDFASNIDLPSNGTIVVVSFDPTLPTNAALTNAFRTQYGITASVLLVGPFAGSLSNSTERVTLQFVDAPPIDDPTTIPRITADEVIYDDESPWPTAADGTGPSLQRIAPSYYGNAAATWSARPATPGTASYTGGLTHDLNGDGAVNAKDVDYLFDVSFYTNHLNPIPQLGSLNMDYDGSFSVNTGDVTAYLRTAFQTRFGDANLDGFVDASDFNLWNANRFKTCKSWADGDFSGDGIVDTTDFNRWALNRFQSGPVGGAAVAAAAPRMASDSSTSAGIVAIPSPVTVSAATRAIPQTSRGASALTDTPSTPQASTFAHFSKRDTPAHGGAFRRAENVSASRKMTADRDVRSSVDAVFSALGDSTL
jgi:hypothetical protein